MHPSPKDFPSRAAYEAWSGLYGSTIMEGNACFDAAFLAEHVARRLGAGGAGLRSERTGRRSSGRSTAREIAAVDRSLEAARGFVREEGGSALYLRRSGRPETAEVQTDGSRRTARVEAWKRPPLRPVQAFVYGVLPHPDAGLGADFADDAEAVATAEAYVLRGEPPCSRPSALPR